MESFNKTKSLDNILTSFLPKSLRDRTFSVWNSMHHVNMRGSDNDKNRHNREDDVKEYSPSNYTNNNNNNNSNQNSNNNYHQTCSDRYSEKTEALRMGGYNDKGRASFRRGSSPTVQDDHQIGRAGRIATLVKNFSTGNILSSPRRSNRIISRSFKPGTRPHRKPVTDQRSLPLSLETEAKSTKLLLSMNVKRTENLTNDTDSSSYQRIADMDRHPTDINDVSDPPKNCNHSLPTTSYTTLEVGPTLHLPSSQSKKCIKTRYPKHTPVCGGTGITTTSSHNQSPLKDLDEVFLSSTAYNTINTEVASTTHHPMQQPDISNTINHCDMVHNKKLAANPKHLKNFFFRTVDLEGSDDNDEQDSKDRSKDCAHLGHLDLINNQLRTNKKGSPKLNRYHVVYDETIHENICSHSTKLTVCHSVDDILSMDDKSNYGNIVAQLSQSTKDYLRVPGEKSVEHSLCDSDIDLDSEFHSVDNRYRTNSGVYTSEEESDIRFNDDKTVKSSPCLYQVTEDYSPPQDTLLTKFKFHESQTSISTNETSDKYRRTYQEKNPFTFNVISRNSNPEVMTTTKHSKRSPLGVSRSLDLGIGGSSHSLPTSEKRKCLTADCKQATTTGMSSAKQTCKSPLSYPRLLSTATEIATPNCESCSPPSTRIIHKLVRRLSLRRKSSKEKKARSRTGGSVDDLLEYVQRGQELCKQPNKRNASFTGNTTDSDVISLHIVEHENLYRGIIRSLLHPLGCPDAQIGLRPGDLLDRVKLVYDVPQTDHVCYIREELVNKPVKVQATVTLLEGKDVPWTDRDHTEQNGVYCFITLVQSSKGTPSSKSLSPMDSPLVSPKSSPRSSPKGKISPPRSPTLGGHNSLLRSQMCNSNSDPTWNECFYLYLDDLPSDEINVLVCHREDNTNANASMMDGSRQPDKGNAIKAFFKNMLQGTDHDKYIPGVFGRVVLPVRDIPMEGCDRWLNIQPVGWFAKSKYVGQIRLQVAVSCKQSMTGDNSFCAEDYHQACMLEYKYAASQLLDTQGLDLTLSSEAQRTLDIFAVTNEFSKLSQKIMNLTVLLELVFSRFFQSVTDNVLHRAMEDVQMTWCKMQVGGGDFLQKMPLCDAEICLYRSATRRYMEAIINRIDDMPNLFPPSMDVINNLKARLGIGQHLLELDVWDATTSPQKDLATALVNKLQRDVSAWMDSIMESIHKISSQVKDIVIPEVETLIQLTSTLTSIVTPLGVVDQFFQSIDVKYYRIITFETERKFSLKVRELMMNFDKYQTRYHSYRVNLSKSCRLSIKLFLAVRSFYHTIKDNFSERDFFRMTIPSYQDWFQQAVVYWLQMFRTECVSRIQKALEIDKDFVLVTSQLKYSNSSVDAQTCFSEITQEWRHIDIKDPDTAVMGVTKITDMICDGARVYASRIHTILERNCYCDNDETQFDITDRICITLNNIEHVRIFLFELPQHLDFEDVTERMGTKHENGEIGEKSLDTLNRLIENADADILLMSAGILRKVCDKMSVEVKDNMDKFLVKTPELYTATDKVIGYFNTNLKTLRKQLSETIFPQLASQLWTMVVQLFDEHVLVGKTPDYYEHMTQHLRSLECFFQSSTEMSVFPCTPLLEVLKERLEINCWKTDRLMREYFYNLSMSISTPLEYLGHLAIKCAYMEETRGNITLYVKVIQGVDLPGLDPTGLSDPYVILSVQPREIFCQPDQRTRTISQTLQPVFNTTFMFANIPKEYLTETGNCILLTVMDEDIVTSDDFAGEVVIALDSIQSISMNQDVDIAPALLMPLKRPAVQDDGPFKVLREREGWDKSAKQFIKSRLRVMEHQPEPVDNGYKRSGFFTFWTSSS